MNWTRGFSAAGRAERGRGPESASSSAPRDPPSQPKAALTAAPAWYRPLPAPRVSSPQPHHSPAAPAAPAPRPSAPLRQHVLDGEPSRTADKSPSPAGTPYAPEAPSRPPPTGVSGRPLFRPPSPACEWEKEGSASLVPPPRPRAGCVSAGGPPARGVALAAAGGAAGLHQSSPVG